MEHSRETRSCIFEVESMKTTSELLSTGLANEGTKLMDSTIYPTLLRENDKTRLSPELISMNIGPESIAGESINFNLITKGAIKVHRVAEGALFPLEADSYTSYSMKPVKKGLSLEITTEMQEDGKFALLSENLISAGRALADEDNTDMIADALANGTNTISSISALSIANITRAMQYLEDSDFLPTDLIVGNEMANDLRNIDTFVEADKSGSTEMIKTGFIGVIYGMRVWRVSSTIVTTTNGYVIDRASAIIKATKRPITIKNFDEVKQDLSGSVISTRYVYRQKYADAICKLTA